jgi:hypothetical protein
MGIEEAIGRPRPRTAGAGVSAYGELVGVLWDAGECEAAARVEEYWNRLLEGRQIRLFCGYPIDVFTSDFERGRIGAVLRAHGHVLPTVANGKVGEALRLAMAAVLGADQHTVQAAMSDAIGRGESMPEEESAILWLRDNCADAEAIMQVAGEYFRGCPEIAANTVVLPS